MHPEEIYLQHLRTIERIASFVARRNQLNPDETAEFVQEVRVRLLDDDYSIIRKYEGRSLFSTYLVTVIKRLFFQWRTEQRGKWRPSAEAKRLGETAILLERYMSRDGLSFHEAVQMLTTPAGSRYTVAELEAIYLRLPMRNPRPVHVSDDVLPEAVAVEPAADEAIERQDREETARAAVRALDEAIETFGAEDRLVLQMRFWHGRQVTEIARALKLDQKKLFKRVEKLIRVMRRALERARVTKEDIARLLKGGDQEIRLDILSAEGIGPLRPSHKPDGEDDGGEGGEQ